METTLHRQLKAIYSDDVAQEEVTVERYRIDVVGKDRLIEIQYGSLGAIRNKVRRLLMSHRVLVVKPLAARKFLVVRKRKGGRIKSSRYSPARKTYHALFDDLVHFVDVFPHPLLTLEVVLTEQEEHRVSVPRRRWRSKGYRVEDRSLRAIHGHLKLQSATDLISMLPATLANVNRRAHFSTEDISREVGIPRSLAQKMAYCLRKTGATTIAGKQGNAILYRISTSENAAA